MPSALTVTIGIGIPGSGKSTVLRLLYPGAIYICPDDIRRELTGDASKHTKEDEVWAQFYERIAAALAAGQDVVVDATNANALYRRRLVNHCRLNGPRKGLIVNGVWFTTPFDVCLRRNKNRERKVPVFVMERMRDSLMLDPPTIDEGFTRLVELDTSTMC